jgi:SAM-dependent methyltransferase
MRLPGTPLARLRAARTRLRERGDAVECPICSGHFARFLPYGGRDGVLCPGCGAAERHRLLWLWLNDPGHPDRLRGRMLAFGPDDATEARLRARPGLDYLSADIDGSQAMTAADVTDLPFEEGSFDSVLCSHVLEHVPDEAAALAEVRRVLRPGGWAAIMLPVDRSLPTTVEDPAAGTPEARQERFGHWDHVRLYGADVARRIGADEVVDVLASVGEERVRRHGLRRTDRFGPDEIYLRTR